MPAKPQSPSFDERKQTTTSDGRSRRGQQQAPSAPCYLGSSIRQVLQGKATMIPRDDEFEAGICILCSNEIAYGAVVKCKHTFHICWICEVRLRLIKAAEQKPESVEQKRDSTVDEPLPGFGCPYCSDSNVRALLSKEYKVWEDLNWDAYPHDPRTNVYFGDEACRAAYWKIQEPRCWFDECLKANLVFESLSELAKHTLAQHRKKVCVICFEAKRHILFPAEHSLYDPDDLPRHCREGDRTPMGVIDPHVWCQVCKKYYVDGETFDIHWRESDNHFSCRLCREDGLNRVIFGNYDDLMRHHETRHYTCAYTECRQAEQVFRDNHSLQLHMAKEHFEASDFFSHAGKRGIRINLSAQAPIVQPAFERRQNRRARKMADLRNDPCCALWPLPMIGEADALLDCVDTVRQRYDTETAMRTATNARYGAVTTEFLTPQERKDIASECSKLLGPSKGRTQPHEFLGFLARTVYSRWLTHTKAAPADRRLTDDPERDRPPGFSAPSNTATPMPTSQETASCGDFLGLTKASEIILLLILSIPPQYNKNGEQKELLDVIRKVATYSKEARKKLSSKQQSETPSDIDNIESSGVDAEHGIGYLSYERDKPPSVLETVDDLPLGENVTFVEAVEWALKEYIKIVTSGGVGTALHDPKIPVKVPPAVVERMRALYSKPQLEQFSFVIRDLHEFIPSRSLEAFLSLRAQYASLKRSEPPAYSESPCNNKRVASQRDSCKRWAARCDQAFHGIKPSQLLLLRLYVTESRGAIPTASEKIKLFFEWDSVGELPELKSGVEKDVLISGLSTLPQGSNQLLFHTGTNQVLAAASEEEYPELQAGGSRTAPIGRPSGSVWGGSTARAMPRQLPIRNSLAPSTVQGTVSAASCRHSGSMQRDTLASGLDNAWSNRDKRTCPRCKYKKAGNTDVCPRCHMNLEEAARAREPAADYPEIAATQIIPLNYSARQRRGEKTSNRT